MLKDDYDFSLEPDEEHQVEPPFIIELDEDDTLYKEAVPPAPKLQGTIPRSDGSNTSSTGLSSTNGSLSATSVLIHGENSFTDGECVFFCRSISPLLSIPVCVQTSRTKLDLLRVLFFEDRLNVVCTCVNTRIEWQSSAFDVFTRAAKTKMGRKFIFHVYLKFI